MDQGLRSLPSYDRFSGGVDWEHGSELEDGRGMTHYLCNRWSKTFRQQPVRSVIALVQWANAEKTLHRRQRNPPGLNCRHQPISVLPQMPSSSRCCRSKSKSWSRIVQSSSVLKGLGNLENYGLAPLRPSMSVSSVRSCVRASVTQWQVNVSVRASRPVRVPCCPIASHPVPCHAVLSRPVPSRPFSSRLIGPI